MKAFGTERVLGHYSTDTQPSFSTFTLSDVIQTQTAQFKPSEDQVHFGLVHLCFAA